MRLQWKAVFPIFLALTTICGPAFAHHGTNITYDSTRVITQEGTVAELQWTNPHSILKINVTDDQGKTVLWLGELHPPALLVKLGWSKDCLMPGDKVTVTAHPSRTGAPVMEPLTIKTADGKSFDPGRPNQQNRQTQGIQQ